MSRQQPRRALGELMSEQEARVWGPQEVTSLPRRQSPTELGTRSQAPRSREAPGQLARPEPCNEQRVLLLRPDVLRPWPQTRLAICLEAPLGDTGRPRAARSQPGRLWGPTWGALCPLPVCMEGRDRVKLACPDEGPVVLTPQVKVTGWDVRSWGGALLPEVYPQSWRWVPLHPG